jgi:hypothetical protein
MKTRAPFTRFVRPGLLTLGLLTPVVLIGMLSSAPSRGLQQKNKAPTAKEKFKNIKVLKNLPADQLIPVMRKIDASLGVRCDFCHVINPDHTGFERDDKPTKEMARKMLVMTNELNARQKILGKQATCYMCHHGHPEPETKAPDVPPPAPTSGR